MLRIVNLEEVQQLLLRVPALVDLQEQRDAAFVEATKGWLAEVEHVLENNRLPAGGKVAALRAMLLGAERHMVPPGVRISGRETPRKVAEAAAALALQQTTDLLYSTIAEDARRVADAERLGRQLVAIARAKGILGDRPHTGDRSADLRDLWDAMRADVDVSAGTTNVEGLVGPQDALVVLDRTLARDTA